MQAKLRDFILAAAGITDYKNIDPINAFNLVIEAPLDGDLTNLQDFTIVVATEEPVNSLSYINGIWVNLDSNSNFYQKAMRLIGVTNAGRIYPGIGQPVSDINPVKDDTLYRKWEVVQDFEDMFKYLNLCFLAGAIKGEKGDKGDKGDDGDTVEIDYDAVVNQAVLKFQQSL